jgi:integrase/recombinase XerD
VSQDRCYNKDNNNKRSNSKMPIKLSTTVQKIFSLSNKANSLLLSEFYEYMKSNSVSESHQNNNLKMLIAFARYLGASGFVDINTSESITNFLNSKLKSIEDDPDRKCLTT